MLAVFAELSCSGLRYWTDTSASCLPTNVSVGQSCKTLNYIQRQLYVTSSANIFKEWYCCGINKNSGLGSCSLVNKIPNIKCRFVMIRKLYSPLYESQMTSTGILDSPVIIFYGQLRTMTQKIKLKQLQHHTFPMAKTPTDTKVNKTVQNTKLAAASRYKNHSGQYNHRGHCCVMAVCGAQAGSQNSAAPLDQ